MALLVRRHAFLKIEAPRFSPRHRHPPPVVSSPPSYVALLLLLRFGIFPCSHMLRLRILLLAWPCNVEQSSRESTILTDVRFPRGFHTRIVLFGRYSSRGLLYRATSNGPLPGVPL